MVRPRPRVCHVDTSQFVELCARLGVKILNLSAGSPYYNPHIQRPAAYPPSDGYQPPEDPLVGVARQINVVRQVAEFVKGLKCSTVEAETNSSTLRPFNFALLDIRSSAFDIYFLLLRFNSSTLQPFNDFTSHAA